MTVIRGLVVGLCLFVAGLLALPSRAQFNGCPAGFCSRSAMVIASVWGDKGTFITLSTTMFANDTASGDGANWAAVRGTKGYSTGKWCVDFVSISTPANFVIGLADATTPAGVDMNIFLGGFDNSGGHLTASGQGFPTGSGFAPNDIGESIAVADGDVLRNCVDFTNGFWYLALNGAYYLSGDPTSGATGIGHVGVISGGITAYPGVSMIQVSAVQIKTTGLAGKPSGYSDWGG